MIIFVRDSRNRVLAPTVRRKWVSKMIQKGKAKFIKGRLLTIQLTYPVFDAPRDKDTLYSIGIDSGYKYIGFTVVKVSKNTISKIFTGEVELRTEDIKKLLEERKMYRQSRRRNRRNKANSTKFRHPRWKNRKDKEKISPTVRHLIQSHSNVKNLIFKYIPKEMSKINLEYAKFDSKTINKPGSKSSFTNIRYFVLNRDRYTCQYCTAKDVSLQVHHKIMRSNAGSNNPNNLVTLCHPCHAKHHAGKINANNSSIKAKAKRDAGVLNTAMSRVYLELAKAVPTYKYYGYETFDVRNSIKMPKSHANDSFILATFGIDNLKELKYKDFNITELFIKQIRRHSSRAKTSKMEDRKYRRYNSSKSSEAIAYNRNKRTGQTKNSINDHKRLSRIIPNYNFKIKVYPGGPVYRQEIIDFNPGDLVRNLNTGDCFIVKSNILGYKVSGYHGETSPRQNPKAKYPQSSTITLKRNSGLVII